MSNIVRMRDKLVESEVSSAEHRRQKLCNLEHQDTLDGLCFLGHLRLELQRVQRSEASLSVMLLTQKEELDKAAHDIRETIHSLEAITRETDIVGYVDRNTIGIILPYTDANGAAKICSKVEASHVGDSFKISHSTYPDQLFESLAAQGCVSSDVINLMFEERLVLSPTGLLLKRAMDVVGAISGLILLSPIMLVTAIFVKLDSSGPVIFKQVRLGQKGLPFIFYKFRSMRMGASDQIHREFVMKLIDGKPAQESSVTDKPVYKMKADPRITPFGRFIRKTSIDELPQLYNVLKGEMSLVGPRPPLTYEVVNYKPWHLRRVLDVKPGMTGLWQVEGRSRTGFNEAVRLDVKYLQSWSLMLDIKILLKTVVEVFRCRGAV